MQQIANRFGKAPAASSIETGPTSSSVMTVEQRLAMGQQQQQKQQQQQQQQQQQRGSAPKERNQADPLAPVGASATSCSGGASAAAPATAGGGRRLSSNPLGLGPRPEPRRGSCFPGMAPGAVKVGAPTSIDAQLSSPAGGGANAAPPEMRVPRRGSTAASRALMNRRGSAGACAVTAFMSDAPAAAPPGGGGGGHDAADSASGSQRPSLRTLQAAEQATTRMLAPFRRKSLVDHILLGDVDRLTRNPPRYGLDTLVIHPNNRAKALFDAGIQLLTIYTLSVVPLEFAFGFDPPFAFDVLTDIIFMMDVVLHFFHGFIERGYPVLRLDKVASRYLSSWFLLELIASIPYDLLSGQRDLGLMSLLRIFRLRRLGAVMGNSRVGRNSSLAAFLRVLGILLAWITVAHCFACVFFALGWRLRCTGPGYEETWLDVLQAPELNLPACRGLGAGMGMNMTAVEMFPPALAGGGAAATRPHNISWLEIWVLCLHWAISSMSSLGYGRGPTALTIAEFSFTVACQVLGACLYAAIFGNIAQLLAKLDAPGARYRAQRDKIDEFVAFHELPAELTSKLHAYCKFLFAVNHGFDIAQISGALPPNLQHQLLLHLHAPLVKSVPMFEECDDAFIKAIVLQLRPQVLLGGDAAFKANEAGTEMYFIMRGEMRMMDESLTVCYNALYSGAYFGELAMLTGQPRTATALAVTDCVLFYINQQDFNLVARKWPKALATILAKAKERLERINNNNSRFLADQLGERLHEVGKIVAEESCGILNLPAGGGGGGSSSSFKAGSGAPSFNAGAASFANRGGVGGGGGGLEEASVLGRISNMPDASILPPPTAAAPAASPGPSGHGGDSYSHHVPRGYGGGGGGGGSFHAGPEFAKWQRKIEQAVEQANDGVQLILERLVNTQLHEAQHSTTGNILGGGHGFGVVVDELVA